MKGLATFRVYTAPWRRPLPKFDTYYHARDFKTALNCAVMAVMFFCLTVVMHISHEGIVSVSEWNHPQVWYWTGGPAQFMLGVFGFCFAFISGFCLYEGREWYLKAKKKYEEEMKEYYERS